MAARCDYLKNLVLENCPSDQEKKSYRYQLPIKSDQIDAFRLVLQYLYTDQIRLDPTQAFSPALIQVITKVLQLSIDFQLVKLEKLCIKYLEASVNVENVLETLKNAFSASSVSLVPIKEYCLKFIIKEAHYNR